MVQHLPFLPAGNRQIQVARPIAMSQDFLPPAQLNPFIHGLPYLSSLEFPMEVRPAQRQLNNISQVPSPSSRLREAKHWDRRRHESWASEDTQDFPSLSPAVLTGTSDPQNPPTNRPHVPRAGWSLGSTRTPTHPACVASSAVLVLSRESHCPKENSSC